MWICCLNKKYLVCKIFKCFCCSLRDHLPKEFYEGDLVMIVIEFSIPMWLVRRYLILFTHCVHIYVSNKVEVREIKSTPEEWIVQLLCHYGPASDKMTPCLSPAALNVIWKWEKIHLSEVHEANTKSKCLIT